MAQSSQRVEPPSNPARFNLISTFSEKYVFRWTGIDQDDQQKREERARMVMTVNEMRSQERLPPLDGDFGDAPLNPSLTGIWMQLKQGEQQQNQQPDFGQAPDGSSDGEDGDADPQQGEDDERDPHQDQEDDARRAPQEEDEAAHGDPRTAADAREQDDEGPVAKSEALLKGGKPGASGLVRRVVTDKNGRSVTQWVRAGDKSAGSAPVETSGQAQAPARQFTDTERAYGGRAAYDAAVSVGRTKLTYRQWVQVRTPNFKRWFGDFEAVRGVRALQDLKPLQADDVKALADQAAVEEAFSSFSPELANKADGRVVRFPVSMAGKITRHKGFDVLRIAGAFDRLFADAVPMFSEPGAQDARHGEQRRNIDGYSHYVGKFTQDRKTHYVRFTVRQMHARKAGSGESIAHSSFVSDVAIYNTKGANAEPASLRVIDPVLAGNAAPFDKILAKWLKAGNPDTVSKVLDPDTGEPMVVYHGGGRDFTKIAAGGRFGNAIFVRQGQASGYGAQSYAFFLRGSVLGPSDMADMLEGSAGRHALEQSVGRPLDDDTADALREAMTDGSDYPTDETVWNALGAIDEADAATLIQRARGDTARALGFDAVRTPDEFDGDTLMVLVPGAIKSATDNDGSFNPDDDVVTKSQAVGMPPIVRIELPEIML